MSGRLRNAGVIAAGTLSVGAGLVATTSGELTLVFLVVAIGLAVRHAVSRPK